MVMSVWVIDDGSSDATGREARGAGAVVIRHETNLGKGASLREGLESVRAAGYQWAVTLDGDGQHDPAELGKFWEAAHAGADLVIGNRMLEAEKMRPLRRFVNRWMSARISGRLGMEIPDSQSGYRLIRVEAWREASMRLQLRENRFAVESELLMAFARAGKKVAFVPVKVLEGSRPSRIRPVVDTVRWLRWWGREGGRGMINDKGANDKGMTRFR